MDLSAERNTLCSTKIAETSHIFLTEYSQSTLTSVFELTSWLSEVIIEMYITQLFLTCPSTERHAKTLSN